MAEIKLRQITMQMLLRAMLVGGEHTALEYTGIAFNGVRGDLGLAFEAYVFVLLVVRPDAGFKPLAGCGFVLEDRVLEKDRSLVAPTGSNLPMALLCHRYNVQQNAYFCVLS